jgi:hypothetical protein
VTTFPARRLAALVAIALVSAVVTGCAPGTPDEDSWRGDATRAVGDVASAAQSARLGLSLARRDRLPHTYVQTVMVDAERTAGMSAQTLSAEQPPDVELPRAAQVNDRLAQVVGVITEARIAVVAGDSGEFADLEQKLSTMADDLSGLEGALSQPPAEASP